MPPPRTKRPILLLDLMAIVAAVAFTLISPAIMRTIIGAKSLHSWDRRQYVEHLSSLILLWWTATLLVLVFAISRSKFRRSYREPGHAAVLAVGAAFLILALQQAVSALAMVSVADWPELKYFWVFSILERAADASGASVVAVWLILALTRAGRRSSDWFDRLCCVAGLSWISWAVTHHLVWILPITWLRTSGIR